MTVLVTGAAGFIGASLTERLLRRGDDVIGIDNFNDYYSVALKRARRDWLGGAAGGRLTFLDLDFADTTVLDEALASHEFDRILHVGAQPGVRYSLENPQAYIRSNLAGHLNILELARRRGIRHTVYASSSSVYGNNAKVPFAVEDRVDHPISLYAATKKADELMSESYAHLYRLPLTGLRFFTVYGPWGRPDMMVWSFTESILNGRPIQIYNSGEMWRDFTYIDDIAAGVLACLDSPPADDGAAKAGGSVAPHAIYNIGNNRSERLLDVIDILEAACGRVAQREFLPMQPGDVLRTYADIDAISRDHGYQPTVSVAEGIPRFVQWYKDLYRI
jgi:UDP-glucuronate 4-epimerase